MIALQAPPAATTPTRSSTSVIPEPEEITTRQQCVEEWLRCQMSCEYFTSRWVQIYDATSSAWLPFHPWPAQVDILNDLQEYRMVIILKARQLGISWVVLAYALWRMIFYPAATVSIFSKRDDEAVDMLDFRLKGMNERLPPFLRASASTDARHQWLLSNGSRAMAFPATAGRSYTSTIAIVDEADYVKDLPSLMNAVQPTVDAGGQMIVLSTPDKSEPQSLFKRMYISARQHLNEYKHIFLSWRARPGRTQEWYNRKKQSVLAEKGALDDLHQEYPATDTEALAPNSQDKRIPATWIELCYDERTPLDPLTLPVGAPTLPGLDIYRLPRFGEQFVLGADPAEGNPTSDDSAFSVLDRATGEECAAFAGKVQPAVFGAYIKAAALYFNRAGTLVERNNHGHAVLLWLSEHATQIPILMGEDGRAGWLSNSQGKTTMYDSATEAFRLLDTTLHNFATYVQLASIEGATLRAPKEEPDDRADSYALAVLARSRKAPTTHQSNYMLGEDGNGHGHGNGQGRQGGDDDDDYAWDG